MSRPFGDLAVVRVREVPSLWAASLPGMNGRGHGWGLTWVRVVCPRARREAIWRSGDLAIWRRMPGEDWSVRFVESAKTPGRLHINAKRLPFAHGNRLHGHGLDLVRK